MNGLRIALVREQVLMISKVPEMSVESRESIVDLSAFEGFCVGLLINFNTRLLPDAIIRRII